MQNAETHIPDEIYLIPDNQGGALLIVSKYDSPGRVKFVRESTLQHESGEEDYDKMAKCLQETEKNVQALAKSTRALFKRAEKAEDDLRDAERRMGEMLNDYIEKCHEYERIIIELRTSA